MEFAKKVSEMRKGLGLSPEEFGSMVNVSRQAVSKWELGQSKPDIDTLALLSRTLNISCDDLILSSKYKKSLLDNDIQTIPLEELMIRKRRFSLGIVMMIGGVLVLFGLWFDIRVGSLFYTRFWVGIADPLGFIVF